MSADLRDKLFSSTYGSGNSNCSVSISSGTKIRPVTATEPPSQISKLPVPSKMLTRKFTFPVK